MKFRDFFEVGDLVTMEKYPNGNVYEINHLFSDGRGAVLYSRKSGMRSISSLHSLVLAVSKKAVDLYEV